ncbi:hypothetical protein Ccrd_006613 [Cynara cardunculus var. scolymus]|uniref:Uncharacterized protein n=1 Tax=Cynara cardunculus var. scolymus TaxID=59895 RepID=A0A103XIG5_CYNCS|nr:hypothetical protein Ccrd_006613 [Cynara cardunculus var. scolymus]
MPRGKLNNRPGEGERKRGVAGAQQKDDAETGAEFEGGGWLERLWWRWGHEDLWSIGGAGRSWLWLLVTE